MLRIIRIDESSYIRIVVSGLQIVEIRFRVQIIPSVPERVHYTDAVGIRQDSAVAPGVIAVTCNFGAACVVDCEDPPAASNETAGNFLSFSSYLPTTDKYFSIRSVIAPDRPWE